LSVSNNVGSMIDDMLGGEQQAASPKLMLQDYKKFKHGKEVTQEDEIQYLKQHLLAQALVHHKHVIHMTHDSLDPNPTNTVDFIMMASRVYSTENTWYVEYEVTGPPEQKEKYEGEVIQILTVLGTTKSTNHKSNVLDLIKQMYPKATTLADIVITKDREAKILQAIAESYSVPQSNPDKEATRKRLEAFVHETRVSETVPKAIAQVQQRQKEDSKPLYRQITETFESTPESIWEEIDILEGDPDHRGMVMRNARFKPFWFTAESSEWEGLWNKGVFKKWKSSDLLKKDRVFTIRYVYKIKRSAKTGVVYRFKTRLIVRGFEMEKGKDYDQNFSPIPGIAIARIIASISAANDLDLHSIDIEQVFLQTDKLMEGVNDRYFINPPPGSPDANNKDIVYEVLIPSYGNPSSPRVLHKTMDVFFKIDGFDTIEL
jgi:hypothetical protein